MSYRYMTWSYKVIFINFWDHLFYLWYNRKKINGKSFSKILVTAIYWPNITFQIWTTFTCIVSIPCVQDHFFSGAGAFTGVESILITSFVVLKRFALIKFILLVVVLALGKITSGITIIEMGDILRCHFYYIN